VRLNITRRRVPKLFSVLVVRLGSGVLVREAAGRGDLITWTSEKGPTLWKMITVHVSMTECRHPPRRCTLQIAMGG